jgi:hypothetical protein
MRAADATAGTTPPPPASAVASANCAEPENTSTEHTTGAITPQPSARAVAPNVTASTKAAAPRPIPVRMPARKRCLALSPSGRSIRVLYGRRAPGSRATRRGRAPSAPPAVGFLPADAASTRLWAAESPGGGATVYFTIPPKPVNRFFKPTG